MLIKGPLIQRGNPERKWDAKRGWTTTEKLRGEYSSICAFAMQQLGAYSSINISPEEGGLASLTLTLDGADPAAPPKNPDPQSGAPVPDSEIWEMKGNDLTKDVWSHKRLKNLNSTDYLWLRENVKTAAEKGTWYAIEAAITSGELKKMFRLFMDGIENYSVAQYVLTRQLTTSGSSLGSFVTKGENLQYTTQQIIADFGVPNGIRFTLPQGAWIMRTPTVNFDGAKWSNTVEWWHAEDWNEVLYPKSGTPEAAMPPPLVLPPSQQTKPPVITLQPLSAAVSIGDSVELECQATGTPPIQFAWFHNGTLKTLGPIYSVASFAATDVGSYVCKVTNVGGMVSSNAAGLSDASL